ncbi:17483_t:CDS:1, partial [Dentiscutata erythropus]
VSTKKSGCEVLIVGREIVVVLTKEKSSAERPEAFRLEFSNLENFWVQRF